jgi:hypothetical protein
VSRQFWETVGILLVLIIIAAVAYFASHAFFPGE